MITTNAVSTTPPSSSSSSSSSIDNVELNKDDFLKLLVAQVQNQDPMNPEDSTQQTQQMTFFSMVEQLMNISTAISTLNQQQDLSSAASMIGHTVTYTDANGDDQTGLVDHVDTSQTDGVQLALADGTKLSLADVSELK